MSNYCIHAGIADAIRSLNKNKKCEIIRRCFVKQLKGISLNRLITRTRNANAAIFQGKDQHDNDGKRKLLKNDPIILGTKQISTMHNHVFDTMKAFDGQLTTGAPSLLLSEEGCQRQIFHYDFDPSVENGRNSFLVLAALMDDTKFIGYDPDSKVETIYVLNAGDVLVARGDFLHAGADYDKENLRVHWYVDLPHSRDDMKTYAYDIPPDCNSSNSSSNSSYSCVVVIDFYAAYYTARSENASKATAAKKKKKELSQQRREALERQKAEWKARRIN